MTKITFHGKEVIDAVNTAGTVVTSKLNPSLQYLALNVNEDTAVISTTNLEQFLSISVPVSVEKDNDIPIPVMYFDYSILKDVVTGMNKNSDIVFEINGTKCTVVQGKSHYKMDLIDPSNVSTVEQPAIKNPVTVQITEDKPIDISKVLFAVSKKAESRREFQGVLFDVKDSTFKLVATDGTVLAVYSNPVNSTEPVQAIIPGRAVSILQKIASTNNSMNIEVTKNIVKFTISNIILSTLCINGTFPPYEVVLNTEANCSVTVDRDVLLLALNRLNKISKRGTGKVVISINGDTVKITATAPGQIEGSEEITAEGNTCSKEEIALHADKLYNAVQNCNGKIRFCIKGALSPIHIDGEEENYRIVIMPQKA
jgi:DNA polymerase III sliding clamp (beta) subunit (PCNA family)